MAYHVHFLFFVVVVYSQKKNDKNHEENEVEQWFKFPDQSYFNYSTVEPRYNEDLGTMKIFLLEQLSHYIRVKNKEI